MQQADPVGSLRTLMEQRAHDVAERLGVEQVAQEGTIVRLPPCVLMKGNWIFGELGSGRGLFVPIRNRRDRQTCRSENSG